MLAVEMALEQLGCDGLERADRELPGGDPATSSRAAAWSTASAGLGPHANGPCEATRTPGTASGSRPSAKRSTMTRPVLSS